MTLYRTVLRRCIRPLRRTG